MKFIIVGTFACLVGLHDSSAPIAIVDVNVKANKAKIDISLFFITAP